MTRLVLALLLLAGSVRPLAAQDPEIVGTWFGAIDTDRGQMEIGLTVSLQDGKLQGTLKTAHGDWKLTTITEKAGTWTVGFKGADNEGQMIGRITNGTFAGDWKSAMANGTFEVSRSKKKS